MTGYRRGADVACGENAGYHLYVKSARKCANSGWSARADPGEVLHGDTQRSSARRPARGAPAASGRAVSTAGALVIGTSISRASCGVTTSTKDALESLHVRAPIGGLDKCGRRVPYRASSSGLSGRVSQR